MLFAFYQIHIAPTYNRFNYDHSSDYSYGYGYDDYDYDYEYDAMVCCEIYVIINIFVFDWCGLQMSNHSNNKTSSLLCRVKYA